MSAVGSLIYATVVTRPDIAYAVSKVGQHMSDPTNGDWNAVIRILRYLKGTEKLGPTFDGELLEPWRKILTDERRRDLYGFSDADWATDKSTRRSQSGYIFMFEGSCIS